MDTIAEFVVRVVGSFIVEVVFVGIFYWPGWLLLRVITFGRYPPGKSQPHSKEFVAGVGLAAILVAVLFSVPGGGF